MEKGIVKATEVGTPQGGNLSPLLSNIMLNELDKELVIKFDDDKQVWYQYSELEQIEHAYAITVHKAQRK